MVSQQQGQLPVNMQMIPLPPLIQPAITIYPTLLIYPTPTSYIQLPTHILQPPAGCKGFSEASERRQQAVSELLQQKTDSASSETRNGQDQPTGKKANKEAYRPKIILPSEKPGGSYKNSLMQYCLKLKIFETLNYAVHREGKGHVCIVKFGQQSVRGTVGETIKSAEQNAAFEALKMLGYFRWDIDCPPPIALPSPVNQTDGGVRRKRKTAAANLNDETMNAVPEGRSNMYEAPKRLKLVGDSKTVQRSNRVCWLCDNVGHQSRECPERFRSSRQE